ncbi:unnamed protein product [Linum trigynum]|uniref:Uncharacterized protein n=1 Tax=Linum trigynum TaxID=586398 RepID=A0AAV2D8N0_9ROSI
MLSGSRIGISSLYFAFAYSSSSSKCGGGKSRLSKTGAAAERVKRSEKVESRHQIENLKGGMADSSCGGRPLGDSIKSHGVRDFSGNVGAAVES